MDTFNNKISWIIPDENAPEENDIQWAVDDSAETPGFFDSMGTDVLKAGARGVVGLGEMVARIPRAFDIPGPADKVDYGRPKKWYEKNLRELTDPVVEGARQLLDSDPLFKYSEKNQQSIVRRAITGGIEAVPQSAFGMTAAAMGPAAWAGLLTTFGANQYSQYLDKALSQGKTFEESLPYALASGIIEGGGETIADVLGAKLLNIGGAGNLINTASRSVKDLLKMTYGSYLKGILKQMPIEVGTEVGQNVGEALVEHLQGLDQAPGIKESAIEAIGPSIVMTALFGIGSAGMNTLRNREIKTLLENPEMNPEDRAKAAGYVYEQLSILDSEKNTTDADIWDAIAMDKIQKGEPIDLSFNLSDAQESIEEKDSSDDFLTKIENRLNNGEIPPSAIDIIKNKMPQYAQELDDILEKYKEQDPLGTKYDVNNAMGKVSESINDRLNQALGFLSRSGGEITEDIPGTNIETSFRPSVEKEMPTPKNKRTPIDVLRGQLKGKKGGKVFEPISTREQRRAVEEQNQALINTIGTRSGLPMEEVINEINASNKILATQKKELTPEQKARALWKEVETLPEANQRARQVYIKEVLGVAMGPKFETTKPYLRPKPAEKIKVQRSSDESGDMTQYEIIDGPDKGSSVTRGTLKQSPGKYTVDETLMPSIIKKREAEAQAGTSAQLAKDLERLKKKEITVTKIPESDFLYRAEDGKVYTKSGNEWYDSQRELVTGKVTIKPSEEIKSEFNIEKADLGKKGIKEQAKAIDQLSEEVGLKKPAETPQIAPQVKQEPTKGVKPGTVRLDKGGVKPFISYREIAKGKDQTKVTNKVEITLVNGRKIKVNKDQIREYPQAPEPPKSLKDVTVKVKAIRESTGEIIEVEENAQEALNDIQAKLDIMKELKGCLA